MNKTNIKGCRRMLEARRAELLSNQHDTEGIAIERVPDSMDEFSLEVQRGLTVDAMNRKATLLRQVAEALERITGGKYGVCLACQEAISPKRLAALPWAALCFECQQAEENAQGTDAKPSPGLRLGYDVRNKWTTARRQLPWARLPVAETSDSAGLHERGSDQVRSTALKRNGGVYVRWQRTTPRRASAGQTRSPRRQFRSYGFSPRAEIDKSCAEVVVQVTPEGPLA